MPQTLRLRVNGREHALEVEPDRLLLDCLRDDLELTGTKEGCGTGSCGACSVLMDGQLVSSCLVLAVSAEGREIVTIEALACNGELHPVQAAFVERGGLQCGFCTPGMVLATAALLDVNPDPSEDEIKDWLMGNLCRCTGYYKILESVRTAAARAREGSGA
ncbi:MAG: (2Fe-2S)-binding protein [Myxococcota bacterium]